MAPYFHFRKLWTLVVLVSCAIKSEGSQWDYFVFTQEWPESACIAANQTGHSCVIPDDVKTWTIHGLWPDLDGHYGPSFCNDSWKFDESKIKSLEPRLDIFWPNLYLHTPTTDFWKHEWTKHGTCCTDLESTRDEYHYFSTGLSLNLRYNITQVLANNQIVPGQSYALSVIEDAFQKEYKEPNRVLCNHYDGKQYLNSIEICLDRGLSVISCDRSLRYIAARGDPAVNEMGQGGADGNECSTHEPVIYPVITGDYHRRSSK